MNEAKPRVLTQRRTWPWRAHKQCGCWCIHRGTQPRRRTCSSGGSCWGPGSSRPWCRRILLHWGWGRVLPTHTAHLGPHIARPRSTEHRSGTGSALSGGKRCRASDSWNERHVTPEPKEAVILNPGGAIYLRRVEQSKQAVSFWPQSAFNGTAMACFKKAKAKVSLTGVYHTAICFQSVLLGEL